MPTVDNQTRLAIATDEAVRLVARLYPNMAKAERDKFVRKIVRAVAPSIKGIKKSVIKKLDAIFERDRARKHLNRGG